MIIDVHHHFPRSDYVSEDHWQQQAQTQARIAQMMGVTVTPEEFEAKYLPPVRNTSGEAIIQKMDEAGIAKTVLLPLDLGLTASEGKATIEQQNEEIAEVARTHPDRFIYFCGVNPRREEALALFQRAISEWGAKGLKLHPLFGHFYPDDKKVDPLLEEATQRGLPVLFHIGRVGLMDMADDVGYAHPSRLRRVLTDFPNLTVIAAHMGFNWWRELIELAKVHPNLMCDISAYQITSKLSYPQLCHILRLVLDAFGKERVLFGTDGPFFHLFASDKEWVELLTNLPQRSPPHIPFSEDEIHAILHSNGERLFGFS